MMSLPLPVGTRAAWLDSGVAMAVLTGGLAGVDALPCCTFSSARSSRSARCP